MRNTNAGGRELRKNESKKIASRAGPKEKCRSALRIEERYQMLCEGKNSTAGFRTKERKKTDRARSRTRMQGGGLGTQPVDFRIYKTVWNREGRGGTGSVNSTKCADVLNTARRRETWMHLSLVHGKKKGAEGSSGRPP